MRFESLRTERAVSLDVCSCLPGVPLHAHRAVSALMRPVSIGAKAFLVTIAPRATAMRRRVAPPIPTRGHASRNGIGA